MNKIENRWFQWIAGDKKGEVMIFDKIEIEGSDVFIIFKDTSRINQNFVAELNKRDLTEKFMAEVDSPNNLWKFKEEWVGREEERWEWQDETNHDLPKVCVQPAIPGRKVIKLIPPRPTAPKSSNFGTISNQFESITPTDSPHPPLSINESDPVYILMSKSKKIDKEISMTISISLPPKNLYDIAKESFDDGEKKFVSYIIDNITVDEIKNSLKIAITEMYENP